MCPYCHTCYFLSVQFPMSFSRPFSDCKKRACRVSLETETELCSQAFRATVRSCGPTTSVSRLIQLQFTVTRCSVAPRALREFHYYYLVSSIAFHQHHRLYVHISSKNYK
jgi:hypothetical protein